MESAPWTAVGTDFGASLVGGPSALPLDRGSLLLVRDPATLRATRGTGRAAGRGRMGKCGDHDVAERLESDFAVAQLGPLLRHSHRDRSRRVVPGKSVDDSRPLLIAQRRGLRCHPGELYSTVRRVDMLSSRPRGPRELPLQLGCRNHQVRRHFEIHRARVAYLAGQTSITKVICPGFDAPRSFDCRCAAPTAWPRTWDPAEGGAVARPLLGTWCPAVRGGPGAHATRRPGDAGPRW